MQELIEFRKNESSQARMYSLEMTYGLAPLDTALLISIETRAMEKHHCCGDISVPHDIGWSNCL